ncbi:Glutamate--tRNA ligase [Trichinella spiralis]|uniref:Glutamate--tRNA ligase n=1 Tax=Trichinella spiralis TaxID=6334 RepID=A0ABR3K2B5_TRISP
MDWQGLGSVHFRISEGEQIATIKATARGQAISCFCTAQLCSACPPENFRMLPFPWGRYNFLSYNYAALIVNYLEKLVKTYVLIDVSSPLFGNWAFTGVLLFPEAVGPAAPVVDIDHWPFSASLLAMLF